MPERNCNGCKEAQQKMWGCTARKLPSGLWENPAQAPNIIGDEETWACPRQGIKNNPTYWRDLLMYYKPFTLGVLPDRGAITDQSARGFTLLSMLDTLMNNARAEKWEAEKAKR